VDRWTDRDQSPALTFGLLFHSCLEYNAKLTTIGGVNYETALHTTVLFAHKEAQALRGSEDTARTPLTLVRAVVWYIEDNRHSPIHPVVLKSGNKAVELDWEIVLPLTNPDGENYTLRGHIDQVVELPNDEGYAIDEYKTTKMTLGTGYFAQWKPNNQTTAYALAGRALFFNAPKEAMTGPRVLIRACQTLVNGTRFAIHSVEYSMPQLEEFLQDTLYWITKAEEYANMGYWPMNRTACDSKGGCWFRDVCSRDPSVRPVVLRDQFHKLPSVYESEGFTRLLSIFIPPPNLGEAQTQKDHHNAENLPNQPSGL
jgi:hypothetical protein